MNQEVFKNIVSSLKGNSSAVHLDDIDISWDIPNQLLESNELLLCMLTKTSMITFIDDYTKISSEIGLTSEEATSIQQINEMIIALHKLIRDYCTQQFVIGSTMKTYMDEAVLSSTEITDIQSIDDIMKYIQDYNNSKQIGGGLGDFLSAIIKVVLITILSMPTMSRATMSTTVNNLNAVTVPSKSTTNTQVDVPSKSSTNTQVDLVLDGINRQYNTGVGSIALAGFQSQLTEMSYQRNSANVNSMVVKYDTKMAQNQKTLFNMISMITSFGEPQLNGNQVLQKIIDDFNRRSIKFSSGVENTCIALIRQAYESGVYKNYMNFDEADETKEKIQEIKDAVSEELERLSEAKDEASEKFQEEVGKDVTGIVGSAVMAAISDPVTGVVQTSAFVLNAASNIYNLLSSSKEITTTEKVVKKQGQQAIKDVSQEQKQLALQKQLTPQQQVQLENKLFQFSTVYCSNTFNLQLQLEDLQGQTNINVLGDKIDYDWVMNVIALLDMNISVKQQKIENPIELKILDSLRQRLDILKQITFSLFSIVNFSHKSHLTKLNIAPTEETLGETEKYFNEQLRDLETLLERLNQQFPQELQAAEQQLAVLEGEKQIQILSNKIKQEQQQIQLQGAQAEAKLQQGQISINQIYTQMRAQNISATWDATSSIASSYVQFVANATSGTLGGVEKMTNTLLEGTLGIPIGAVRTVLKKSYSGIAGIAYDLIFTPGGCIVMVCGIIFLAFAGSVYFVSGGKLFFAITKGSIITIYQLIKSPFGLMYRLVETLYVPPVNGQPAVGATVNPGVGQQPVPMLPPAGATAVTVRPQQLVPDNRIQLNPNAYPMSLTGPLGTGTPPVTQPAPQTGNQIVVYEKQDENKGGRKIKRTTKRNRKNKTKRRKNRNNKNKTKKRHNLHKKKYTRHHK